MKRGSWLALGLVLLPLVVYWPTIAHEYGFRDDYANLREAHERPGWLTELTTAHGRPIFGVVLEASLREIDTVAELPALRFGGALLLGVTGLLLCWSLRRSGWAMPDAVAVGALATVLPGAQVVVGWAITWPIALGLVAALCGFLLVEAGLDSGPRRSVIYLAAGALLYFATGLIYQTSALFVVAPLAAALLVRKSEPVAADVRRVGAHLGTVFVSLAAGYALKTLLLTGGAVQEAARMQFEPDPLLKLLWFGRQPLPNAVALFALRDRFVEHASFWLAFALVVVLVLFALCQAAGNGVLLRRWWFCLLGLPFVAHSVSLAASSQSIGYRTLLPLSALVLVLAVFALCAASERLGVPQRSRAALLAGLVVFAALAARHNAFELIAVPQGREWQLIRATAFGMEMTADTRAFIARPMLEHRSTQRIFADEFGSLSADAQWAALEMFKAAMRLRFPDGLPEGTHYSVETGFVPPTSPAGYAAVLDMRELARLGDRTDPGS